MKSRKSRFLDFAAISGLLVVIPVLFSILLVTHVIDTQKNSEQQASIAGLDERAQSLFANLDAENLFSPGLEKLGDKILPICSSLSGETGADAATIEVITESAQKTFVAMGQQFNLFVFDARGRLVNTKFSPLEQTRPMQYIWNCIIGKENRQDYNTRKADVSSLLGRSFSITRISHSNGVCFPTFNYGRHGLFYHRRNNADNGGIIAFSELNLDFAYLLHENVKRAASHESPIILRNRSGRILHGSDYHAHASALFDQATTGLEQTVAADGNLWKKFAINDMELLFGTRFSSKGLDAIKYAATACFLLLICFSLAFLSRIFNSEKSIWLSIRLKLIVIFLFAVYLPVLGLFLLGFNGLRDHRTVLENETRKGLLDIMMGIDSGFSKKEKEIATTFERFFLDRSWHRELSDNWKKADLAVRKSSGTPAHGENFFNWLEVRDIHLNQLYSTSTGEANDRVKAMGRTMSLICLEKTIPERLQEAGTRPKQSDLVLVNLLENPVIGFSHLFERPGRVVPMQFEGSSVYWYWNFYPEKDSKVAFVGGNSNAYFNACKYLDRVMLERFTMGDSAVKVIAFHPGSQFWWPAATKIEKPMANLFKLAALNDKAESSQIEFAGKKYIAACMPGIKLQNFYIACLFPGDAIDARISGMWSSINLGVVFILLIAALTGMLLSKTFLQPISELSSGLSALRKRNTEFRVKIDNQDELGDLGQTFNQMMDDVKEMLIAGTVQKCLIPEHCPEIKGYECLIYNRMAADVGGDYADIFSLGNSRYLIVLGDVTGHGVSSSLLTAMVKASVFRFASAKTDLRIMLKRLSIMIFELLNRRKLMTFCAIILDTANNSYAVANAGHPFPLVVSHNGSATFIEHSALPLGVSPKRSNYEIVEGHLQPEDMLFIYSDGIVEGTNPDGEEFGLQRIKSILSENTHSPLTTTRDRLLNEFSEHYRREELDDDLTFIMFKRQRRAAEQLQ